MTERVNSVITYSASGTAIIGGLTMNDWAMLIGSIVAVLSLAHEVWHKRQMRRIAATQRTREVPE